MKQQRTSSITRLDSNICIVRWQQRGTIQTLELLCSSYIFCSSAKSTFDPTITEITMSAIVTLRAIPTEVDTGALKSVISRDVRRAYISPATLRTHKVAAGDWMLFKSGSAFITAQAWPKASVDDDGKFTSSIGKCQ